MKKILSLACILLATTLLWLPALADDAAEPTVYVSAFGNDANTGTIDSPVKTLYSAIRALPTGGRVVVLDTIRVAATEFPTAEGLITITSKTDKDYRSSQGGNASIYLSGNLNFTSAVKMEYLDVVTTAKNLVFMCNGNYACFGEGLTITAGTEEVNLPSIAAGRSGATPAEGAYLEIHSGNWFRVRGGSRGTSSAAQKGDITLVVYGGTFTSTFDVGGDSATEGSAYAYIYGGDFGASVNCASAANIDGDVYLSIYGGTFASSIRASRGGTIGGNFTVNVCADVNKNISAGTGAILGTAIANVEDGRSPKLPDLSQYTLNEEEYATLTRTDASAIEAASKAKLPAAAVNPIVGRDVTPAGTAAKTATGFGAFCGDINNDGRVTVADSLAALKSIGNYNEKADANGDGEITVADTLLLLAATLDSKNAISRGDTENRISDTLELFGGAKVTGGKINRGFAFGAVKETAYTLYSDVVLGKNATVGLYFGTSSTDPADISGYYFEVNTTAKTLTLYRTADGIYRVVAQKKLDLFSNNARIRVTYRDGAAELYFEDNPYATESYFDFDLFLPQMGYGVGLYAENATATLPICVKAQAKAGSTYKNHILEQFTDPEVFYDNGRYYLYGTRTSTQNRGVQCFSTTDFVNFTDEGMVLQHGDAFGDGVYKAANIVKYGDWYYLFYMAKSNEIGTSVTAFASAKSPIGPFTNSTKEPLSGDTNFIGGQPFVDTDGKVYLIYARTTGGNKLYGAEIELTDGQAKLDVFSEELLLTPTEDWENAKASVVECGYLVKHNGLYYLLYSGGNYNSTYGTGYATSNNPLGPYTKYEHNPILVSNDQSFGVGAATVFVSPDGAEHFIAYLRNFSPTVVRPLQTCIDRIRFVKDPNGGADRIEICGPSVNAQPLPGGMETPTIVDYQYARFHW